KTSSVSQPKRKCRRTTSGTVSGAMLLRGEATLVADTLAALIQKAPPRDGRDVEGVGRFFLAKEVSLAGAGAPWWRPSSAANHFWPERGAAPARHNQNSSARIPGLF